MSSLGKDSSSNIFLIDITNWSITICDNCGSPLRCNGRNDSPCGPPFLATGIIAPGFSTIVFGFKTPSSAAVYTPAMANDAFFNNNSLTLFKVFMSGIATVNGPRPYTSPAAFMYLDITHGEESSCRSTNLYFSFS